MSSDELVHRSAAEMTAAGFQAVGEPLDVTRAGDWARVVEQTVARWGGLDVLVNNAGISPRGTVESTDEALWERTLAINLKGAWLGIKAALPVAARAAGDDRQHRLDPGDPAHAGALLLRRQQGRAVGPDPAGRRRVPRTTGSPATWSPPAGSTRPTSG